MFEVQSLIDYFQSYGYIAVFSVLLLCGFGLPIPEDITLVAGGVISGLGHADIRIMVAVGMVGVLIGDSTMFLLGRVFGERVLQFRLIARLVTKRRYERVQAKFQKHGQFVLFAARFMPGLRSPIFVVAGMTRRVSFFKFIAIDGFAALISVPVWVYAGFLGADNIDALMEFVHRGQTAIFVGVAILISAFVSFKLWRRRASKPAEGQIEPPEQSAGESAPRG